ncbi:MAG TPA: cation:proton antiporter [Actinomycetota bacterium]|nr:cation:proton antiporter [Actinomycetota bacterium]
MDLVAGFGLIGVTVIVSGLVAGLVDRGPISFPMIFLGLGLALGASGLLDVDAHNPSLEVVAALTLSLVLFMDAFSLEGGRSKRDWLVPALVLGPGTLLVILVVAGAAMLLFDLPPVSAFIVGAVLASTDAVVLRDVVRDDRVPRPVRRVLSVEAGTNDIIVLPLLLVLIAVASGAEGLSGPGDWGLFAFRLLVVGPVIGAAIGAVGAWLMARADARYSVRREYQALFGVGLVLASFAAAVAAGGDGFLAAFFAGLSITALDQTLCDCFLEFGDAAAEISMLLAFVLFGALLAGELGSVPLAAGLALAAVVIFVARPLAIGAVLSIRPVALSRSARAFISWFGPRGLNSLLFALLVVAGGVPDGERVLAITGLVVLVSVVVHGASATPVSGWYGRRVSREVLVEERFGSATDLFERPEGERDRMSVERLAELMDGEDPPVVVDVRTRSQHDRDAVQIPGSVRVLPDSVPEWASDQLKDQPYVLYCT